MAKVWCLLVCLLVGQAMCYRDYGNYEYDDDEEETDEPSSFQEVCKDNESYKCENIFCNHVDKEKRKENIKNCPETCDTCLPLSCKDTKGYEFFCKKYGEVCNDSVPVKSPLMAAMSNSYGIRKILWTKCRKTCNYGCPRKEPMQQKTCEDKLFGCCWHDKTISSIDPKCKPCKERFPQQICRMFRNQCTCDSKLKKCTFSGALYRKYCPATCGLCKPEASVVTFQ